MNVFIGPVEIAGIAHNLATGLTEQEVNAQLITKTKHPFNYSNQATKQFLAVWQLLFHSRAKAKKIPAKALFFVLTHLYSHCILIWGLIKFDAFIFFGAQTITNTTLELKILKALSKKIIFVYTGSDARPLYMNGAHVNELNDENLEQLVKKLKKQHKRLCVQEKYADYCVNAPGTAQFQTKPFIDWFALGIPTAPPGKVTPTPKSSSDSGRLRILHCPSNSILKGSHIISGVVKRLKQQGQAIEFIELKNVSNSTVLEHIRKADIVVDQLYSDTPMATFASEAASIGKPVIVAGYFAEQFNQRVNAEFRPPTFFVTPENFEEKLTELVTDEKLRVKIAEESFLFVSKKWDKKHVCKRYLQLLNDDVPATWWIKPDQVSYIYGCGACKQQLKKSWRLLEENYGREVFCLNDKPKLLKMITQESGV